MAFAHETHTVGQDIASSDSGVRDFYDLMKPRVMSLVVFTAIVGLALAPGALHPLLAVIAVGCIAVGAGASGALNMWFDADIDLLMKRTARRPIPSGRVASEEALAFGLVLSVLAVLLLAVATNLLAAGLLAFTIFFYVAIYTMWLKRWTPQNIVIGGAAGALPPMIAWAAVTGSLSIEPVILFAIIFMWTPPHFWALALVTTDDYAKANVPMLPVVAGGRSTKVQIVAYTLLLVPLGMAPWYLGFASPFYAAAAGAFGLYFLWPTLKLLRTDGGSEQERKLAIKTFLASLVYLFAVFSALLTDAIIARFFLGGLW